MARNSIRTKEDRVIDSINTVALILLAFLTLYPLIYVISMSISSANAVLSGRIRLWPIGFTLVSYKRVLEYPIFWNSYYNTVWYTVVGSAISVFFTVMCGYAISRKDFVFKKLVTMIMLITMLFSGGMIPTYLVVQKLGIMNSRWAMLLPNAIAVWNVIITRTYYQAYIPDELLEAAKMDGCSDFRFMRHVVLPLSGAITAVNVLFYAVGHWNQYFQAFLYLNDQDLFPLQIFLRQILVINDIDADMMQNLDVAQVDEGRLGLKELIKYAVIIVASVPMLIVYPFAQRHFVKGVMIGSLKG